MSIAYNIKRLRTGNNLTQEQLAESLTVTRQAISSWENGRTMPDVETIGRLAQIFNTDMEDLIYGKRKKIGFEEPEQDKRHRLILLIGILGGAFAGIGLVFIFVWFWSEMPDVIKKSLAFIPEVILSVLGVIIVCKKTENKAVKELAAILWSAGIVTTNALVNSLFSIEFGFMKILLLDIILLLPVAFVLSSVAATVADEVMLLIFLFKANGDVVFNLSRYWIFPVIAAVFVLFTLRIFGNLEHKIAVWSLVIFGCAGLIGLADFSGMGEFMWNIPFLYALIFAEMAILTSLSGDKYRFDYLSVTVSVIVGIGYTILSTDVSYGKAYGLGIKIAFAAIIVLMLLVHLFIGKAKFMADKPLFAFSVIESLLGIYCVTALGVDDNGICAVILCVLAGVALIVKGIIEMRILWLNLGIIAVVAEILAIFIAFSANNEMLVAGICLLLAGIGLLVSDKIMLKKKIQYSEAKDDA